MGDTLFWGSVLCWDGVLPTLDQDARKLQNIELQKHVSITPSTLSFVTFFPPGKYFDFSSLGVYGSWQFFFPIPGVYTSFQLLPKHTCIILFTILFLAAARFRRHGTGKFKIWYTEVSLVTRTGWGIIEHGKISQESALIIFYLL